MKDNVIIYKFAKKLFCSAAKESLSKFAPILYSRRFMLRKKEVYNGSKLELYTLINFQLRLCQYICFFIILMCQVLVDKQMCFGIHHYLQNTFCSRKNYDLLLLDELAF